MLQSAVEQVAVLRAMFSCVCHVTCGVTTRTSIHSMVLQSIKSNMGHVWMDCPHREKLGWMEVARSAHERSRAF